MTVIGFDFDECLAQGYSITYFSLFLEGNISEDEELKKYKEDFYTLVAKNEIITKGTIFRPSLLKLMPKLLKLRQEGHIERLFIYSNNRINELLNSADHILALVLQNNPYNVNTDAFIEENGRLQVLSPRITHNDSCRGVEPLDEGNREKTFNGITSCLGMSLVEKDLWFLDDTKQHISLMNSIGDQYINVKPYEVKLNNEKLIDLFFEAFPINLFTSNKLFLTEFQRVFTINNLNIETLRRDFEEKLNKLQPDSKRATKVWNTQEVNKDIEFLEKSLEGAITLSKPTPNYTPLSNTTIGGSQSKYRKGPRRSRSKIKRGLRTLRKRLTKFRQ
jgi:hypothetical protein